jgi:hypothetical protein
VECHCVHNRGGREGSWWREQRTRKVWWVGLWVGSLSAPDLLVSQLCHTPTSVYACLSSASSSCGWVAVEKTGLH